MQAYHPLALPQGVQAQASLGRLGAALSPPFLLPVTLSLACGKMREEVKSMYVAGKVRMAMAADGATLSTSSHTGHFVMRQMFPSMWLLEASRLLPLAMAPSHGATPLAAHATKGGSRPLRRAIQAF